MTRPTKTFQQLTTKQQKMLIYIQQTCETLGRPPTQREIMHHLSLLAVSTVAYNLKQLETWGFVSREPGAARGLQLTESMCDTPISEALVNHQKVIEDQQRQIREMKREIKALYDNLDRSQRVAGRVKRIMIREGYTDAEVRSLMAGVKEDK